VKSPARPAGQIMGVSSEANVLSLSKFNDRSSRCPENPTEIQRDDRLCRIGMSGPRKSPAVVGRGKSLWESASRGNRRGPRRLTW
jgi:hypothetical protein